MDLHPGRKRLPDQLVCSVCVVLTGGEMSVVLTHVLIPITWTSSRNVNPTSWFILSVLFLTVGETSVVPTHVWDPPSHGPPPQ